MRKRFLTFALGAFAVAAVVPAMAQETKPIGISLRAGAIYPTSKAAENISKTWLAVGMDYKLSDLTTLSRPGYNASLSLSVDYYNREDYRAIPVTLNYVVKLKEIYCFAGAGVGFDRIPTSGGQIDDKARFAYQLGAGYNVPTGSTYPLFVEVKFFGHDNSELNGAAAYVGIRF